MNRPSSTTGRLLVAEPELGDPNFERTVVFMLDHNAEGAVGVVLNRPTELAVADVLADWSAPASEPAVLFVGGPVSENAVLALARHDGEPPLVGWTAVLGTVGTLDLHLEPGSVTGHVAELRLFAGYSGWGPGQLEFELDEGAWFVVDALETDVFSRAPTNLWRGVLRRQPDRLRLLADYPVDVIVN